MKVKKWLLHFLLLLFFTTQSITSFATHIFGGELLYAHVSGNTYKLTLTVYGDCSGPPSTFGALGSSTPQIFIFNGNTFTDTIRLTVTGPGVEVSPVCPKQLSLTSCHGGTLPGVTRFIYSGTVTLPAASASWRFIFAGNMGTTAAGRSSTITNIFDPGSSNMSLEADLNNTAGNNSSPLYTTVPTPFYCVSVPEQYNQGAIDPDGDSLVFSLEPGYTIIPSTTALLSQAVNYVAPYSATAPLDAASFTFSILNGQMSFTPNDVQSSLVVNRVSEYRNGVLIGSSEREMTFIVTNDCQGSPPGITIDHVSGGGISDSDVHVINVCRGTPQLNFNFSFTNPDEDSTTVTAANLPAAATFSVTDNNTPNPSFSFSWNTFSVTPGLYTFFVTVKNNHCPLANTQTIAYSINIVPVPVVTATQISPTQCVHKAYVEYELAYGYVPRTLIVISGTNIINTYLANTPVIKDSIYPGNYTAVISSDSLCRNTYDFSIADGGVLPLSPFDESLCQGDAVHPINMPAAGNTAVFTWFDTQGNPLPAAPTPNTTVPGTTVWNTIEHYKVCTSDKVAVTATVHAPPDIEILSRRGSLCYGDSVYLTASGGTTYYWTATSHIFDSGSAAPYIKVLEPAKATVHGTDQYGCSDSASISYTDIEQCCNFSYPDAFTPNNDGRNDGFRVITYGNMINYRLAIYNRFGQLVFLTFDVKKEWDGKFNGIPCEMGTYYYYFRGMCLATGRMEEHKGDVTLVR